MFRYVIIIGFLTLGCSTLSVQDRSDDDAAIEHLSVNVLDPECNKKFGFTIKDFSLVPGSITLHERSFFEGKKGEYLFCASKKYGLTNDDGSFNTTGLKADVEFLNPEVRQIVQNCSDQKGATPMETFKKSNVCALTKLKEYRIHVKDRYYYETRDLPEPEYVDAEFRRAENECSNKTGGTLLEVRGATSTCIAKKVIEAERKLGQRYQYKVDDDQENSNIVYDIVPLPSDD